MTTASHTLVAEVLDAHGGLDRWRTFSRITAKVVSGGFLWAMKGTPLDSEPRSITAELRRQWTRVDSFGRADYHMVYEPGRVVVETDAGELIAQQLDPRETFAGHAWETPWTPLQLAYFNGYAMWTYHNLPFLLAEPGLDAEELPSISADGQMLRGIRVRFPKHIHSHSVEQNLYFDRDGLLRRQDYDVDVAGGARAGHLLSGYIEVHGLMFATKRRVYMRNEDGTLQFEQMPVSIDLSDFELS